MLNFLWQQVRSTFRTASLISFVTFYYRRPGNLSDEDTIITITLSFRTMSAGAISTSSTVNYLLLLSIGRQHGY